MHAISQTDLELILALVTDIDLGVTGANGWDIAEKARNGKPELPVIYMTGASADEWASRGVPRSILLPKPFAMAQVIRAIVQLLDTSIEPPAPRQVSTRRRPASDGSQ
ncbi:MAG: hypothetical protein U1E24_05925 [Phenylobacterium sp.]|nr:hypothetical protein [Phenylobacterium sp.]